MRRLIYSPDVKAFVKTDVGVVDISQYIVSCDISRRINQISSADLTINNPKDPQTGRKLWTDWEYGGTTSPSASTLQHPTSVTYGPLFHPMDPIVITMTRLQGFPIQVFTGYLDKVPYVQIKPGTCSLTASCTLKRLQYTFWDPGLPYVRSFLSSYGWIITPDGGANALPTNEQKSLGANNNALSDSGFADLLYGVLHYVGGWSWDSVYIEPLNPSIVKVVSNLFPQLMEQNKEAEGEFESILARMIGIQTKGGGDPSGTNAGADPSAAAGTPSGDNPVGKPASGKAYSGPEIAKIWIAAGGDPGAADMAVAIALAESGGDPNQTHTNQGGSIDRGLWQINSVHGAQSTLDVMANAKAAVAISKNGTDWTPWSTYTEGKYIPFLGKSK